MRQLAQIIERTNDTIGRAMGWLMCALVLLVTVDVISRYVFNTGAVVIQELEWWLFSIIFLMSAGYTFLYDDHVRVDIVYSRLSRRNRDIVDLFGAVLFLFPMCALVILTSRGFISASWAVREVSPDPGGLPAYYVLKSMIPIGFVFLALQGLVDVYRKAVRVKNNDYEGDEPKGLAVSIPGMDTDALPKGGGVSAGNQNGR